MKRFTAISMTLFAAAFVLVAQTPKMFNSPDDAAKALIDAATNNDTSQLSAILGSSAQGLLTSGNPTQDQEERREFSRLASAKHRIERSSMSSSTAVLLVGNDDWPFPIPLARSGQQWSFDPKSGAVEMQARRIGGNELDVIEICMGYVTAQEAYARQTSANDKGAPDKGGPAYAEKIMSSPGSKDGLYQSGASPAIIPEGLAMAEHPQNKKPYHGYYFRVLKEQGPDAPGGAHNYIAGKYMIGGFALIAWPAEYGVTGIHTFIVSHDAQVFEKDLGPRTATSVAAITRYNPDGS